MKYFLTSVCLFVISSLTVSIVSPKLHISLFHGGQDCPHAESGKACSSHEQESSENDIGKCAVVLFGESSEHFFSISNTSVAVLLDLGVPNLGFKKKFHTERVNDHWARGPPELT